MPCRQKIMHALAFMQDGLGINPNVVAALTAPVGRSDLPTVAVELLAYANANGIKKNSGKLPLQLNHQPADEVAQFLNVVSNIASARPPDVKESADVIFGENRVG
jgi:hypothetical protein